jgi:hypothetical protein
MRWFLLLACCLVTAASSAHAQHIEGSGRFGLSSSLLRYETASAEGSDAVKDVVIGLGAPGFGLSVGGAPSETMYLGVNVFVAHEKIDSPLGSSSSVTSVHLLPELQYVFASSGSTRGYLGLMAGISHLADDDGDGFTSFLVGPVAGAHVFLGPHASLDLGVHGLYLHGSPHEIDVTITGASLAATVGVSVWFGGASDDERDSDAAADEQAREQQGHRYHFAQTTPPARAAGTRSRAERSFDQSRNALVLRAQFELGGSQLTLVSMPQSELDSIYAQLNIAPYAAASAQCTDLVVLINDEPVPATGVTKHDARMIELGGRVVFERFKTLARAHPTFAVEACGHRWNLAPEQIPDLLKFLQLVSQAAIDVQQGRLPSQAPTAQPVPVPATPADPTAPTPASPTALPPTTTPATPAAPAPTVPAAPAQAQPPAKPAH